MDNSRWIRGTDWYEDASESEKNSTMQRQTDLFLTCFVFIPIIAPNIIFQRFDPYKGSTTIQLRMSLMCIRCTMHAVNSLPLIPYGGTDDCPICLTEFREGESVKLIPCCGHVFHPRCLDTWLDSHVTCPVCRSAEWEEICLDVAMGEGSTAESGDTWRHDGVRRTCSCSDLPNRTVLQRSASF